MKKIPSLVAMAVAVAAAVTCADQPAKKPAGTNASEKVVSPLAPPVRMAAEGMSIIAGGSPLLVEITGCGITKPTESGNYAALVHSIRVKYPEGWLLSSVQSVRGKFLATMDTGANKAERYCTFWIDPQSRNFKQMAIEHVRASFEKATPPIGITIDEELNITWEPTEETKLFALWLSERQ